MLAEQWLIIQHRSAWFAKCQEFCCDSVATDEKRERSANGCWAGTDARHGSANTSFDRSFATGAAALSSISCIGLAVRVAPSGLKTWDLANRIRGSGKVRARTHRRCEPPRLTTNYQRDRRYEQGQDSTLILQSTGRLPPGVSWRPRGRGDCPRCRPAPKPRRAATRGGHP